MSGKWVECATQSEVDAAVAAGDLVIVRSGYVTVRASGSATVTASKMVPVHVFTRYGGTPKVTGGIVLKVPNLDQCDAATWLDYHGINATKAGYATLYKAVNDQWEASHGNAWVYEPGRTVTANDYAPTRVCGQGLHLGATPHHAAAYNADATRYVAVKVAVADLIPLGDKVKVRSCRVLHEVTYDGQPLTP